MSRNSVKIHTPAGQRWLEKATAEAAAPKAPAAAPAVVKTKAGKPAPAGAGEIRIIGGQWRRTRLPVAQRPGLRPTPDRVRETLFNWLGQDLTGWRCLDAFAGTGALGFEAASRGAAQVQLVEQDAGLVTQLQTLAKRLQAGGSSESLRVQRGDGLAALRQAPARSVHLVLLDPPFDGTALFAPALQAAAQAVAEDGFVYLEAPAAWDEAALAASGLAPYRYLKAGAVHAHLLRLRAQ
jgi:16S rRNA (guanine966-N2)-methyltransferase